MTRHDVPADRAADFLAAARTALGSLAACAGYLSGSIARAVDEPTVLLIETRWADVGSYRRALSSYDVKVHALPILYTARDEPSAFEVLHARDDAGPRDTPGALAADHARVGLGEAAAARVEGLPS